MINHKELNTNLNSLSSSYYSTPRRFFLISLLLHLNSYSILQFLQSQIEEKEKVQKELFTEKLMMEDKINESIRKNDLFASKLKSYENGWEEEMKISNEKNERIIKLEKESKENISKYSDLKFENKNLTVENGAIKDEIEESKYSVMKLEERAKEAEEASKEWKEKFTVLERTHAKHSLQQKEREESLLEQLEENRRRRDNAENDLLKHKELISFINKLSTEGGEAGRAKARRLSEAVCSDSMKSQNKENVYKHNNNNDDSYTYKNDNSDHNDNDNSISNKKSNKSHVENDTDKYDVKYDIVGEERSRKVRKPSKQI